MIKYYFLFLLFNLTDYLTTVLALNNGAIEVNPVMRSLFTENILGALIFKFGIVLWIIFALNWYNLKTKKEYESVLLYTLVILICGFAGISISNLFWWLI